MKIIDAHLGDRLCQTQQAQVGTSTAPAATRAKGKGQELTAEELDEQLNKLKEQELRCKAMRQAIQDCLVMMQPLRQDPGQCNRHLSLKGFANNLFSSKENSSRTKRKAST